MAEENNVDDKNLDSVPPAAPMGEELDAASRSLSEALRLSFVILKVIMIILVVAFLASGFETVGSDEQAIVLRFGKIREVGLLEPGPHWIFPYPIDEIIKIPVKQPVNLSINSFWYFQSREDMLSGREYRVMPGSGLRPLMDGYCLSRSEQGAEVVAGSDGSDYNIVHTKWQLTYQIDDPDRFFRGVHVKDVKPGEDYFDVITGDEGVKPLLMSLFEDAVVTAMVNYTIDEAISSRSAIPKHVQRLLQDKLDQIESGIRVESVQLTKSEQPPHTRDAFEASTIASQTGQKLVTEARTYAADTLNAAAGPVAARLHAALMDDAVSEQVTESLWEDLGGTARERMADAQAYQTQVVETAKANADYLRRLLPEYKLRPKLVLQKLYLDTLARIYENAEETFVVQSGENGEIRVLVNKNPLLKRPQSNAGQAGTPPVGSQPTP
ncbi:MAG: protease modulator HflK [Phycisphaerales bacterium]|nr:MAG: protease modulator HflK [Phycisphaerales bacterium]